MACGEREFPQLELTGLTMGTTYSVKIVSVPDSVDTADLHREIARLLEKLENAMSTYIADSDLSRFNISQSTDWVNVPLELCSAVAEAQSISQFTNGAFDVTVGPLVNLWGFGPGGNVDKPADSGAIAAAVSIVGYSRLRADCARPALQKRIPELYVDLSAYAKGFAVDRVAQLLDESGIAHYLVEVGGELRMRGRNFAGRLWSIAVEEPAADNRSVSAVIGLTDTAVATSGDYRNFFEFEGKRYSHTIDARTGSPVTHDGASVTVIASSAAYADALATALLVLGPENGLRFAESENIAALFLVRTADGFAARKSSAFPTMASE